MSKLEETDELKARTENWESSGVEVGSINLRKILDGTKAVAQRPSYISSSARRDGTIQSGCSASFGTDF